MPGRSFILTTMFLCLLPFVVIGEVISNPIPVHITSGLSRQYYSPDGLTEITFDPQDIIRNPLPGGILEPGDYDLYVRVAPDESKETVRFFEIGLGDALSYVHYTKPTDRRWIGPIRLRPSTPTEVLEYRGWGSVKLDQFWLMPHGEKATAVTTPVANLEKSDWHTLWLDFAKLPAWFIDSSPVTLRIRAGLSTPMDKTAKVDCQILDYEQQIVGQFQWKTVLAVGKSTLQVIPVPEKYGPYLLRFFVTLPDGSKYEFQRIVARINSPLEFGTDRLGGHGNPDVLKVIGAGWNRMWDSGGHNLLWKNVEPKKGEFHWNDAFIQPSLKTLAVLETTPTWLKGDMYENQSDWLNYVRAVVTRYKGKIPAYEIFNENYATPDEKFCRKHTEIVNATAKVIRECDPNALVLTGGPPEEIPPGLEWFSKMKQHGLFDDMDIISAHLYFGGGGTYPLDQDLSFDAYVKALKSLLDSGKTKGKPLWDTESGLCPMETFYLGRNVSYGLWSLKGFTLRTPVPYKIGTSMMARYLLLHFWHNIAWSYYHTAVSYGNSWALCDFDGTPLPATVTTAQLSRFMKDARADGRPDLPQGLWGLKFKNAGECLVSMWSVNLKPGEKRFIDFPLKDVKVYDMFLNPIEKTDRLEIGIAPIFLVGTAEAVSAAVKSIHIKSEIDESVTGAAKKTICLTAPDYKKAAHLRASSVANGYQLNAIRDSNTVSAGEPKDSWLSNPGGEHWVEYRWSTPQMINRLVCAWPAGELSGYKVEWFDGAVWHSCSGTPDWRTPGRNVEDYTINPVKTSRLRMIMRTSDNKPARVAEFGAYYIPRLTPPIREMAEIWTRDFRPSPEGYIRDWLVCGPFPSPGSRYSQQSPSGWDRDFLQQCWIYGPGNNEAVIKPQVDQEHVAYFPEGISASWTPMDVRVAWQPAHAGADNYLDMSKSFVNDLITRPEYEVEQCIGYAVSYIDVPVEMEVTLSVGSDDGYKIWIDDKIVAEKVIYRGASPDQETYPVKLTTGRHRILVKLHNDIGGHGLYLRFLDKANKPVTDYTVRLVP